MVYVVSLVLLVFYDFLCLIATCLFLGQGLTALFMVSYCIGFHGFFLPFMF